MKQCTKCRKQKSASEFYTAETTKDGFRPECKECKKAIHKRRYQKNRDKIIGLVHAYYVRNREKVIETTKAYKRENMHKYEAHNAVRQAVERGDLPPASRQICDICQRQAYDYHHLDYDTPLNIIPVCRLCHRNIHTN